MKSSFDDLFLNEEIEDIVINPSRVMFFSQGKWKLWPGNKPEGLNVFELARKIAESVDIELGYRQPSADAYWKLTNEHHFRAHVVCSPMIDHGPEITLRRIQHAKNYSLKSFTSDSLLINQLKQAVIHSKNILICGSTGAGKSSLMCSLMSHIPNNSRVLVLEDSPELPTPNSMSSKLLARSDRFSARQGSTWNMTDLVYEALRMRPNRIILGECRGPEALALCRALQTGHSGVMTTVHAGSKEEALERISDLTRDLSQSNFDQKSLWDLIVHIQINKNGKRELSYQYAKDS